MKAGVYYLLFIGLSASAWFLADSWCAEKARKLDADRVSEQEIADRKAKVEEKAQQVLRYANRKPIGGVVSAARQITTADFDGNRMTVEQTQRQIEAIPSRMERLLEDAKAVGAAAFVTSGSTPMIAINDLRGNPAAVLQALRSIDVSIPEVRLSRATWTASDGIPVVSLEYDVWSPNKKD